MVFILVTSIITLTTMLETIQCIYFLIENFLINVIMPCVEPFRLKVHRNVIPNSYDKGNFVDQFV